MGSVVEPHKKTLKQTSKQTNKQTLKTLHVFLTASDDIMLTGLNEQEVTTKTQGLSTSANS